MTEEEERLMVKVVCRVLGAWPAVVLLVGCATTPAPVEQIKYFSQAFVAVNTVGQPLLDDLAISERALGRRNAVARAKKGQADDQPCPSSEVPWALTGDPAIGYIDRHGAVQHAPSPEATSADLAAARVDYLENFAWRAGSVLVRDLADHAPINYVRVLVERR
jgi:hypothetical protein